MNVPYRDPSASLLRRIESLERANTKLRARLQRRGGRFVLEVITWLVRAAFLVGLLGALMILVMLFVVLVFGVIMGVSTGSFG